MKMLLLMLPIASGFMLTKPYICTDVTAEELHKPCHSTYFVLWQLGSCWYKNEFCDILLFYMPIANKLTASPHVAQVNYWKTAPAEVTNCIWLRSSQSHMCSLLRQPNICTDFATSLYVAVQKLFMYECYVQYFIILYCDCYCLQTARFAVMLHK